MNNYLGKKSSAPWALAQPPPVDNKIIYNDGLKFFNKYDSPNSKRSKCKRCGSDEHREVPKCPEYKKDRDLADNYRKLESEATKKLKSGAPVVEGTDPETGNLHATLGIEDDNFSGEDKYALAFLNLSADSAPEVPTKIDSINNDTVFKQSVGKVNPTWLLLYNQSTVNVFINPDMVVNIRETIWEIHVYCNAGKVIIGKVADWPGFGEVWFHRGGIANILSLALVK